MKKVIPLQTKPVASVRNGTKMLNEQQLSANSELSGYHVINSGAGTGKSAAQELQERVGKVSGVTNSTLPSLSYHIIKSSGWNFSVDTSDENQESFISSLISSRTKTTVAEVVRLLHTLKGATRSTLRVRKQILIVMKDRHDVTFDAMINFAVKILRKHAGLRNYWQTRYDFVQNDEAQDLNPAQVELLKVFIGRQV